MLHSTSLTLTNVADEFSLKTYSQVRILSQTCALRCVCYESHNTWIVAVEGVAAVTVLGGVFTTGHEGDD
jgi:hypothetical protein